MPSYSAVQGIFSSPYTCLSSVAVGNPVYLSAADTVALCDGTNGAKMPCIGLVAAKPTTTTCIVQSAGEFPTTGLTAATVYYVGTGVLVTSTGGLAVIQQIGVAKDTTTLVITPSITVGGQSITGNLAVSGNLTVGGNVGFYGTGAQAQPANTVDPRHALVTLGLIASGGNGLSVARRVGLTTVKNADGTNLAAAASAAKFGLGVTIGTSELLSSEAAQNNTKTDTGIFEFVLPPEYIAAQNVTLTVNVQRVVAGGTTLTTSINAHIYKMADAGTMGADIGPNAAVVFTATVATDETFTITGTTLNPGDRLFISVVAIATEGGNTGTVVTQVNSIRLS
jgi:hypothetical protein